jgi:MFS family permease
MQGCTKHWCDRYDSAILTANTIMSIPYFMAACLFPVCGYLVDIYGQRVSLITVSALLLLVVHLLLGLTTLGPVSLMIGK